MDEECLFCAIDAGHPPLPKLYDDDLVYAIDVPESTSYHRAPVHFMVIPHKHVKNALHMTADDAALAGRLFTVAARLAHEKGVAETGFRLVTNTGPDANQTVFHFHLHCIGGRQLGHEG
jgi:histidine triad (HIT) family protein